jgi:phosphoribosylformimino-5-aminoimidazole carboxamide ribotide isomerase
MMLSRVGSDKGIDIQCLNSVLKLAGNNEVYAAGGVRNMDDLMQLNSTGVKGVLLATALHTGAITKEDLEEF